MLLNVDLNVPLPTENREQEGTSTHTGSLVGPSVQAGGSIPCPPIDLEAVDDDVVIISSPSAFAEVWFPSPLIKLHSTCTFVCLCGCPQYYY